jgi:hypothetical protein
MNPAEAPNRCAKCRVEVDALYADRYYVGRLVCSPCWGLAARRLGGRGSRGQPAVGEELNLNHCF